VATFEASWKPSVAGLLTFRGDPNRRFYGLGPVPRSVPEIVWSYPKQGSMCRASTAKGETKTWCGAGWTGQPTIHERDGRTWLIFNAYDGAVHFVDADTGKDILPPFPTGDIIKGTVTVDPDGYPIVYSGSRDNYFRVIAFDRPDRAVELWRLAANDVSPTKWNNDWDGSALVLDGFLLEGGENSQFHVVKLNRTYGADGLVEADPQLVFNTPGWDDQLLSDLAGFNPQEVSIENSVVVNDDTVYFANSGGLVQGWDLAPLRTGGPLIQTFRFWTGDDVDATVVVDAEGFLYVSSEFERGTPRSREVGQLVKLDPRRPDEPIVWSFIDQGTRRAGIWSTPAIANGVIVTTTNAGRVVGLDQQTGAILWEFNLPGPLWQSPVVVDDVLILGDCAGILHAFDMSDPRVSPPELWSLDLGGCIEATPAVWKGSIYLATRGGKFFALRSPLASPVA
jgi:outer membrane protein assembly factor BamB